MTVPMALVDFIPCILFLTTAVLLQKDLYGKMSRVSYTMFSSGTLMVTVAGLGKALWKLLFALAVCDFEKLNAMLFPLQSAGFVFAGIGMLMYVFGKKKTAVLSAAPAVYSGTMLFVVMMVLGVGGVCGGLAVLAGRMRKKGTIVLFLAAFVMLLGMGYLSSKEFEQAYMNWAAEALNTVAQLILLLGVRSLHKAGLGETAE